MAPIVDIVLRLAARMGVLGAPDQRERGDVPGWVLVTVMTAGLVTALWLVADEQLTSIFTSALDGVRGP